jgi:hypothetical protein
VVLAIMLLARRGFLFGLGALLAAPAIVRASSLMPVRAIVRANTFPTLMAVMPDGSVRHLDTVHHGNVALILDAQLVYA